MKFQLPGNGAIRSKMAGKCVSKQKKKKGKTKILLYALSNRENCLNFFRNNSLRSFFATKRLTEF